MILATTGWHSQVALRVSFRATPLLSFCNTQEGASHRQFLEEGMLQVAVLVELWQPLTCALVHFFQPHKCPGLLLFAK